ncbi:Uncharacterised protein [Vibrio cholerae]|nr:Uncharacterised protein [Vibrio cholerae]
MSCAAIAQPVCLVNTGKFRVANRATYWSIFWKSAGKASNRFSGAMRYAKQNLATGFTKACSVQAIYLPSTQPRRNNNDAL